MLGIRACPQQRPALHRLNRAAPAAACGLQQLRISVLQPQKCPHPVHESSGRSDAAAARRPSVTARSAGTASLSSWDGGEREPSELQKLINSIPYRKLFLWLMVALFLWPLHEFFGVRFAMVTTIQAAAVCCMHTPEHATPLKPHPSTPPRLPWAPSS
jgi:hypothetical protein